MTVRYSTVDPDRPRPRLCRTSRMVIHRTDCPQITRPRVTATAWYWAEDKTGPEILAQAWNVPCKSCKPLDGWEPKP